MSFLTKIILKRRNRKKAKQTISAVTKALNPMEREKYMMSMEDAAKLLNTNPEALAKFECAYKAAQNINGISDNYFEINAKQMRSLRDDSVVYSPETKQLVEDIVKELVAQTEVYSYESGKNIITDYTALIGEPVDFTKINAMDKSERPQLTGTAAPAGIPGSGRMLLGMLKDSMDNNRTPESRKQAYNMFRQGLDILDIDSLTYSIIDQNPISMGYWLPRLSAAFDNEGFFKIPNTKIIKVPIQILQTMRSFEYPNELNKSTIDIINNYCYEVFNLDTSKKYFIKTGTHCSKYDFRNALVAGEKEIHELGEYLFFVHQQANAMAHYMHGTIIYGVSTTTEWVVRDFIDDVENNPTIYNGLPLHTEYRVFVDFDTNEVLGVHNYWDPKVMEKTFASRAATSIDARHDYMTYCMNKDRLTQRFEENKELVASHIRDILPHAIDMHGQWSLDIMQNGEDFYFIDAAIANVSAFYEETVPMELRNPQPENWLPDLSK